MTFKMTAWSMNGRDIITFNGPIPIERLVDGDLSLIHI